MIAVHKGHLYVALKWTLLLLRNEAYQKKPYPLFSYNRDGIIKSLSLKRRRNPAACAYVTAQAGPIDTIKEEFDIEEEGAPLETKASYNIAPGQDVLAVKNDGKNSLVECRWGFIPHWA